MLKLIQPRIEHKKAVMDFRQEFLNRGERISGGVGLESAKVYERWLRHEYVPHYGVVKEIVFLAIGDLNHIVGISDIRLQENEFILHFAGQIGYSVRPSERGKGHSTETLKLTLK